jgi:hypothetical protein
MVRVPPIWTFKLTRSAINAVVIVALQAVPCLATADAAPVPAMDPHAAELSAQAPVVIADPTIRIRTEDPIAGGSTGALVREIPAAPSVEGLFHLREFELSVSEEEYKRHSRAVSCIDRDNVLRRLAGGAEDCRAIKPGPDELEIFTLPFLAISGWALVVLVVAGLYRFYGHWRVWRWLRRMRAQGLMPIAPNPRGVPERRSRRSNSRGKSRSRRYAG